MTHEVNTDGGDVRLGIGIVCESQEETRLSDSRVSNQEELEEVVVSVRPRQSWNRRRLAPTV